MYTNVTQGWISSQSRAFAPEGFVEIECYIPDLLTSIKFTKRDLLKFVHRQTASPLSAELPKNHIEFSVDNSDGKWNPSNPNGMYRYLSERLRITVRYGFNIGGALEWIPGGVFYLSEWGTTQNGYEATFVARDVFEYMLDTPYTGSMFGTLQEIATTAVANAELPSGTEILFDASLTDYEMGSVGPSEKYSVAQVLQKCANAARCVLYQNREGALVIARKDKTHTNFTVPLRLSYSYPKIEFSRPMKSVEVTYSGGAKMTRNMGGSGEMQTLDNNFIATEAQAFAVAEWVEDNLGSRKTISGEFRGDPRIDVLDLISVETKYGMIEQLLLTDISINFTGAFATTFKGYVNYDSISAVHYSGELYAGEVI